MSLPLLLLVTALAPPADTVPLSLEDALARARTANAAVQAAEAGSAAADARVWQATRAFLPSTRVELQGLRTTDPVGVFGLKLRQERFAMEDLALDALNRPEAIGGFSTTLGVEMPLLAPEGWFGFSAARSAAVAEEAGARRMAGAVRLQVSQAYWNAQWAARSVAALDTALAAARAHTAQAEAMERQGLVTGLDARMARIASREVEIRLEQARVERDIARSQLATLLGMAPDADLTLTDALTTSVGATCVQEDCDLAGRGDLEALTAGRDAAAAQARSAWWAQLPQVMGFAAVVHHGQDTPWGTGSGDWTVGLGMRWALFPGLSGIGAVREAGAQRRAVDAQLEGARLQAEAEVRAARQRVQLATRALELATAAEAEARTALEQARLRYRTGISPVTELLDVQATATQTALSLWTARRDLLVARAALDFAYGAHDR
ncbi:MAG: TolC family protein [Gemmatimonadota bacterium]|nr:TolC family protein [Gemmatimonadota bacterium]